MRAFQSLCAPLRIASLRNSFTQAFARARHVALDTIERHIERVRRRAGRGGHSASEATLRRIHASSLANLPLALNPEKSSIDLLRIYDNYGFQRRPNLVLEARRGKIIRLAADFPEWLLRPLVGNA